MPRGPRIDAPGILHHVMARGIGRKRIFQTDGDRENFLDRLEKASREHDARIYAWCLMDNHFHLSIRTGDVPLKKTMGSVLTGYAMYFNRRQNHSGHVFQNRYKSIVVDEERYFLSLLRYIHLNPMRALIVGSMEELARYPWSGYSVLMGWNHRNFQNVDEVLLRFGKTVGAARQELTSFMVMDEAEKEKKIFAGGGLRRSIDGEEKPRESNKQQPWAYDERILGSSDFVESVLKTDVEQNKFRVLGPEEKWKQFFKVTEGLCRDFQVSDAELFGRSKRRPVTAVRQLLSYAGSRQLGLSAAEISRVMNVSGQAILKSAAKAEQTWEGLDWLMEYVE